MADTIYVLVITACFIGHSARLLWLISKLDKSQQATDAALAELREELLLTHADRKELGLPTLPERAADPKKLNPGTVAACKKHEWSGKAWEQARRTYGSAYIRRCLVCGERQRDDKYYGWVDD